jgi:hypothetical protein
MREGDTISSGNALPHIALPVHVQEWLGKATPYAAHAVIIHYLPMDET